MLWVRNLDNVQSSSSTTTLSVVLGSEVRISGFLNYENDAIMCALHIIERDQAGLYKYLRVKPIVS